MGIDLRTQFLWAMEADPLPELYNLSDDIGERNNLADENPAKVKEFLKLLNNWLAETTP